MTISLPPGITYDQVKNIPALQPPAGIKSNFNDPPSRAGILIILNAIFLSLMVITVLARLFIKARAPRKLGWDDYVCFFAAGLSIIHTGILGEMISLGYGRHLWDVRGVVFLDKYNYQRLNGTALVYPFCIFFVKLAILLLYLRTFGTEKAVRYLSLGGILFLTLCYTPYAGIQIANMVQCTSPLIKKGICGHSNTTNVYQSLVNIVSDFYLLLIPVPSVLKLQVSKRQRIGLLFIFLAGLVACIACVIRFAFSATFVNSKDKLWNASLLSMFTCVEINVAIIAACIPTLQGLVCRSQSSGAVTETTGSKAEQDSPRTNSKIYDKNYIQLDEREVEKV